MAKRQSDNARTPFRLQGEIDGSLEIFDLEVGEHRVGSSADSDLRLRVPGVSRQHALLVVQPRGLVVEDRGSSNGTFVDGRQVRRAAAKHGVEIRFGPTTLTVQALADEDGMVAIPLDRSLAPDPSRASSLWSEITALDGSRWTSESTADSLRVLDEVGSALAGGDTASALRCLGESLGVPGCCLVEIAESDPIVAGSWGVLPALVSAAAFDPPPRIGRGAAAWLVDGEDGSGGDGMDRIAVARNRQGRRLALVLGRSVQASEVSSSLLRVLARLFAAEILGHPPAPPIAERQAARSSELRFPDGYLVGTSPALSAVYRQLERLASGSLPVLLTGPTGVGKGVIAEILHRSSPRRAKPLIAVNSAALPEDLLEAELFGIGKGVATGVDARPGHFLAADGGTLFLDEIGEFPSRLQAKLLRALQEREIQTLGGAPVRVDVRIIAATNADLAKKIEDGSFREDLYYRLAGYVLTVPSLADCREDLPLFIESFLRRFAEERGVYPRGLSLGALRHLVAYAWPGNVRELEHEIRRLVLRSNSGQVIDSSLLSSAILEAPASSPSAEHTGGESGSLQQRLQSLERSLIVAALEDCAGVQLHAARQLGISRNGLARRMKRLGLKAGD